MDKEDLKCIAYDEGFEVVLEREVNKLLRFKKERYPYVYDIWHTTGTVQKYRKTDSGLQPIEIYRDCDIEFISNLFKNHDKN